MGRTPPSRPSSPTRRKRLKSLVRRAPRSSAEDADGDGQVEARALFLQIGWGEIDGGECWRNQVAGVLDGGANAIAAFADGGVGQANGMKVIFVGDDATVIDLDVNEIGIDSVDSCTEGLEKHGGGLRSEV